MRAQIIIDALVRQTTVLIAQLSTAEGSRSPLGHIANEVFSGLVAELEGQGVSKKVIADMFGMALRSYRQKVQRLGESATAKGVTLWSAVQTYVAAQGSATRSDVLGRFGDDEDTSVRGILNDLVESGFLVRSGRGDETSYRVATEDELRDVGASLEGGSADSLAALVWLQIYREGPLKLGRIRQLVPVSEDALDEALGSLLAAGRVSCEGAAGAETYVAEQVLIPLGEAAGWEAAVVDHHRVVLSAIGAKIGSGKRTSAKTDEVGGSTFTFDLWPGHPSEAKVRQLLAQTRAQVLPLWDEVTEYNEQHRGQGGYQVHFYCGQYLVEEESLS